MSDAETEAVRVLLVAESEPADRAAVLERGDLDVAPVTVDAARNRLERGATVDCVLCPYDLGETDGLAVSRRLNDRLGRTPFVLYAADGDERVASEAVRAGVSDYVPVESGVTEEVAARVLEVVRDGPGGAVAPTPGSASNPAGANPGERPDLGDSEDRGRAVEERERALERAYEVVGDADRTFREKVDDLLAVVREAVGTDYATLSYVDGEEYTFEAVDSVADDVAAGDTVPLASTNCERVVAIQQTVVLNDVERDAPELAGKAGNAEWGISCYLGAPVTVDGEPYGSFCFYGRSRARRRSRSGR